MGPIQLLQREALLEIEEASTVRDVEQLKIKYLGKKGPIQSLMMSLKDATSEQRPRLGAEINRLKEELGARLEEKHLHLKRQERAEQFLNERLDPTLPGRIPRIGHIHPVQQLMDKALEILSEMGFSIQLGPDVETDYYNFEGLNFPPDHPARDMQDTFYLTPGSYLLRTHTSNVQVRMMESFSPPIRIVAPGRCFRNETISARSHVFFHQIEGFYIDKGVTFADLCATMEEFWSRLLGSRVATRFRPSYFPFVEPGLEVDVACSSCHGSGCRLCKGTGWLEVCGAGLIHPEVLKKGNIDPEEYSGYAWGMGLERLAMLAHDIRDIRLFTENDERFLSQFC
jgi:phenylalanyl-tRNA synthetase alpha chain